MRSNDRKRSRVTRGAFKGPLSYQDAVLVTEPGDGRWPSLVQKELGFANDERRFSLWVWQGVNASGDTIDGVENAVGSLILN